VLLRCHEYPDRRLAAVPGCGDRGLIACPGRGRARTYRRISVRKTTRARELAATHPAVRLTPDHWQIALFGNSIGDFQRPGGERWVLEGRLISVALQALRLGTSVVLDFGLWGRDERSALRWLARSAGAACQVVYLPVDKDVQLARIAHRQETTPHQTFPMSEADVDAWREQFQEPDAAELDGGEIPDPPAGWPGWAQWALEQWPTCTDS
jgi:predicted kinase